MTVVAIKVWRMGSDAGYVPSSGDQVIRLVPIEAIKGAGCKDSEALFDIAVNFPVVSQEEFSEQEPLRWQSGVCTYEGVTGTYKVPAGYVAVQTTREDVCTNDELFVNARILNEKSLLAMYHERARQYSALASELEIRV